MKRRKLHPTTIKLLNDLRHPFSHFSKGAFRLWEWTLIEWIVLVLVVILFLKA